MQTADDPNRLQSATIDHAQLMLAAAPEHAAALREVLLQAQADLAAPADRVRCAMNLVRVELSLNRPEQAKDHLALIADGLEQLPQDLVADARFSSPARWPNSAGRKRPFGRWRR
ncbi:hypothetical protein GCM10022226_22200 [Sphaerisporangium flaviroseum]|uniref:Uncharacterized protein n=1 Tax=Sphaerisporangium flaviroseum TaxID=509199 RepID=A0ABP7HTK4_9ACTN